MIVKLNSKFYNPAAIKEAITDFNKVCKGKIINNGIEVELKQENEIKNLKGEFCNYVLGLMKNRALI